MKYIQYVKLCCIAIVLTVLGFSACKKPSTSLDNNTPIVINDAVNVTASVSGVVLDETSKPVEGAIVKSGVVSTTTNKFGQFQFKNIQLAKDNGSVTVIKSGYFNGTRSFKTTASKNHFVNIQLLPKTITGTVNANNGGAINMSSGASISFPQNAFVSSDGAAYSGTASIYSQYINPTASNLPLVVPGDLRGINGSNQEFLLTSYGMVGAELIDASGNALKLAPGKTATINFPIPASLQSNAPTTIPLWHFDEVRARWVEEGLATKNGSSYTATVSHFSWWNVDVPSDFVNLDLTIINATNNTPLANTLVRLKAISTGEIAYNYTNEQGYISGAVPKNETLQLEVVSNTQCNAVVYTQNIGPFATNTSLGNINVTTTNAQAISFSGTVLDCNNMPATNATLFLTTNSGNSIIANTDAMGKFNVSILTCPGTVNYSYYVRDNTSSQENYIATGSTTSGSTVNLNTITACGNTSDDVYIAGSIGDTSVIWRNGVPTYLQLVPNHYGGASRVTVSGNDVYACGTLYNGSGKERAVIWKNGIPTFLLDTTQNSRASSIYIQGSDIYVACILKPNNASPRAALWKNGSITYLSNDGDDAEVYKVFVNGTDVYAAGRIVTRAVIWKNGVVTYLTDAFTVGEVRSLFVSGTDVYAVGYVQGLNVNMPDNVKVALWKNGVFTSLSEGALQGLALDTKVVGTDVHVVGYKDGRAIYWKNGVATDYGEGTLTDIAIKNNNIYLVGSNYNQNQGSVATMWKNGVASTLVNVNTRESSAYSIFVK
jgi:hypothetical protein